LGSFPTDNHVSDNDSFSYPLPTDLDNFLRDGDSVFRTGLTYGDSNAKFVEGYFFITSSAVDPAQSPYPLELTLRYRKNTTWGNYQVRYFYASAATTVSGTDDKGNTYDLNLAAGWNKVLAIYYSDTGKIDFKSIEAPSDMVWQGVLSDVQLYLDAIPTKQLVVNEGGSPPFTTQPFDGNFTEKKISLRINGGIKKLFAPADQANFAFALPYQDISKGTLQVALDLDKPEDIASFNITGANGTDPIFYRAELKVYDKNYNPSNDDIGDVFKGKILANGRVNLLTYIYCDRDNVTISGSITYQDEEGNKTIQCSDLRLSRGWNTVLLEYDPDTNTDIYRNAQETDLSGMEWIII